MADPVTLTALSIFSTAGGSALGAFGSMSKGNAEAGMYNYQAGLSQINATLAKQNASYALVSGEVKAQESGMATKGQIGDTKVVQSGSGLDVNSGSALDVRKSEHDIGAENAGIIRSNSARTAYGYEVEAAKDESQASAYQLAASQSKKAGLLGALGSLLGGASSVSSKWLQAGQAGVGSSPSGTGTSFGMAGT